MVTPLNPMMSLRDVTVRRRERWILREVSADIAPYLVTVLTGPSGAGKTTLLRLCNRLDVPTGGSVLLRGQDIATLDPPQVRRRVGMVFQRPTLLGGTVRENLLLALLPAGGRTPGAVRRAGRGHDGHLAGALERVSLDPALLSRSAGELSGGEAQRVCLARTLLTEPEVLLLDEPTSALDAAPRLAFERLVGELAAGGLTTLWVTHDVEQMSRVARRVMVLDGGRLVFHGLPDRVPAPWRAATAAAPRRDGPVGEEQP